MYLSLASRITCMAVTLGDHVVNRVGYHSGYIAYHLLVELAAVLLGVPRAYPLQVASLQLVVQPKGGQRGHHSLGSLRERRSLNEQCPPHPLRLLRWDEGREFVRSLVCDGEVLRHPMGKVPAVVRPPRRDTMYTAISAYRSGEHARASRP